MIDTYAYKDQITSFFYTIRTIVRMGIIFSPVDSPMKRTPSEGPEPLDITPMAYKVLRRLATRLLNSRRNRHAPQTTSLVHEAYLRLAHHDAEAYQDRSHFFSIAAKAMRYILVDQSRRRLSAKRGGDRAEFSLMEDLLPNTKNRVDLIALDNALHELTDLDERKGRIVELRFFGGLSIEDTAEVLKISTPTVKRDWALAKAWLRQQIDERGN